MSDGDNCKADAALGRTLRVLWMGAAETEITMWRVDGVYVISENKSRWQGVSGNGNTPEKALAKLMEAKP